MLICAQETFILLSMLKTVQDLNIFVGRVILFRDFQMNRKFKQY